MNRHRRLELPARSFAASFALMAVALLACPLARAHPGQGSASTAPSLGVPGPTGKVVYHFAFGPLTGTSSLTWTENGKRFRQETNLSGSVVPGSQTSIESWVIGDGKNMYVWQPMMGAKEVHRLPLPKPGSKGSSAALTAPGGGNLPAFGAVGSAGKLLGKATILGKPCEVRKLGQATIWTWKGLALKMETTVANGSGMSMVATQLETPYKAASALFRIPPGYKVVDGLVLPGAGGTGSGGLQAPVRKGTQ